MIFDEAQLDDTAALEHGDTSQMLRAVASSGAQVRESAALAAEAGVGRLGDLGRPRAVVVAGMGASAIAGDVLSALAAAAGPVPVIAHRRPGLPSWVGAADVVLAVSASGATEETLSAAEEAVRRGAQLIAVARENSPLAVLALQSRGVALPVAGDRPSRTSLWSLIVPAALAGQALGLLTLPASAVEETATALEAVSERCRPASEALLNPGKTLAAELASGLPMVWGTSPLMAVAAARCVSALSVNAAYPAMHAELPEAGHSSIGTFDGPFGALAGGADPDDFFRDRADEGEQLRLHLLLLRDAFEHERVTARASLCEQMAVERGMTVTGLTASGRSALEQLASVIGVLDYASVYLGLGLGVDPGAAQPLAELKGRFRR